MIRDAWKALGRRYFSWTLAHGMKILLRMVLWTCRVDLEGLEQFVQVASRDRCILMLWHNRLAIVPEVLHSHAPQFIYRAFVSQSRDAELLAILANSYTVGRTLRVPHNRRHQALSKMISQLKQGGEIMVVTPDGPRGPRYQIKPGIVLAAKEANAYVIPLTWMATRSWQPNTWDKLVLPMPFSRIRVSFGTPITLHQHPDASIEDQTDVLQRTLKQLDMRICTRVLGDKYPWPK